MRGRLPLSRGISGCLVRARGMLDQAPLLADVASTGGAVAEFRRPHGFWLKATPVLLPVRMLHADAERGSGCCMHVGAGAG